MNFGATAVKKMKRETCGDCGAKEGQLHIPGCDMERCPFCGGQLISCPCLDKYKDGHEAWWKRLNDKGRVPYIQYPNLCAKCGVQWPDMFSVPDEDWEFYVEPSMRHEMLCASCFLQIKAWIDGRKVPEDYKRRLQKSAECMKAKFDELLLAEKDQ